MFWDRYLPAEHDEKPASWILEGNPRMVRMVRRKVLACAATAAVIGGSVVAVPAMAASANQAEYSLTKSANNDIVDQLDAELGTTPLADVLADGNRDASPCNVSADHFRTGLCWQDDDYDTKQWWPQGITTTADADESGSYQGNTAIVASWYDNDDAHPDDIMKGARLSFIDYSDPDAATYRHVLLVTPTTDGGEPSFEAAVQPYGANLHAGGMFWYGPYLYVADTDSGYRVYDVRHIYQVTTGGPEGAIGRQSDGSYMAHGYKYVLPEVFTYDQGTVDGVEPLRFSFTSLDRTSDVDSAVMGEYAYPGEGTRVARFPMDPETHLMAADDDGKVVATEAHTVGADSMQGAASIDGKFHLSTSDGDGNDGDWATYTPDAGLTWYHDTLARGAEDFSYWGSEGQMWTLMEYPGYRAVYAVDPSSYE